MRNAVLGNFQPLSLRSDKGALWENFLIAERLKNNSNALREAKPHFWRTATQQEIDFIEEDDGKLSAFEIKSGQVRWKPPATFVESYPDSAIELVNNENWEGFLGI